MPPKIIDRAGLIAEEIIAAKVAATREGRQLFAGDLAAIIRQFLKPDELPVGKLAFGDPKKIPPSPEDVTAYSASIGFPLDGAAWCDSYAAKGWKVGKVRMTNWQAAVRNWKTHGWTPGGQSTARQPKDYSKL